MVVRGRVELPTFRFSEGLYPTGPQEASLSSALRYLHKGLSGLMMAMLAPVPPCTGECRFVRGDSVGSHRRGPDLWGFCGTRTRSSTTSPGHQEHPGNTNGAAPGRT